MISVLFLGNDINKYLLILELMTITSLIYALYLLIIKKKNSDYKFSFGEFISLSVILSLLI